MLLLGLTEVVVAFLSFYILYRSSDKTQNFMFFLFGLTQLTHGVCTVFNLPYSGQVMSIEHLFVQVAIVGKFWQIMMSK